MTYTVAWAGHLLPLDLLSQLSVLIALLAHVSWLLQMSLLSCRYSTNYSIYSRCPDVLLSAVPLCFSSINTDATSLNCEKSCWGLGLRYVTHYCSFVLISDIGWMVETRAADSVDTLEQHNCCSINCKCRPFRRKPQYSTCALLWFLHLHGNLSCQAPWGQRLPDMWSSAKHDLVHTATQKPGCCRPAALCDTTTGQNAASFSSVASPSAQYAPSH